MTLYLGAPLWGQKTWVGSVFPRGAKQRDFLAAYSRVFNTVEGNTTFYAIPSVETVERWRDEVAPGFKFALKVPQAISHHKRLRHAEAETSEFVDRLRLLGERNGPCFLQLPPTFSAAHLPDLDAYLDAWPKGLPIAVEPRHAGFFGAAEAEFDTLLRKHNAARCIFDTASLFSVQADGVDADAIEAQRKKPRLPTRFTRTGPFAFVRFVCQPQIEANRAWLEPWAERVTEWLNAGDDVFFFVHHPDDTFAPDGIRLFHGMVAERIAVPPLPAWESNAASPTPPTQASLF